MASLVIVIKAEQHPLSKDATVYRAYHESGEPLYLGRDRIEDLKQELTALYTHKNLEFKEG
jgi:hypothetical protein